MDQSAFQVVQNDITMQNISDSDATLFLLLTIINTSEGLLNPDIDVLRAMALLKENPKLTDMLKAAWVNKSFKDIRRLGAISI